MKIEELSKKQREVLRRIAVQNGVSVDKMFKELTRSVCSGMVTRHPLDLRIVR